MNTKKLTEAALLSALFIVFNIMAVYTGMAYLFYFDMIVPLFVSLIYMRLGSKYTLLSAITSLLITVLSIGDLPSAIWMSQGIILGYVCGHFIVRKSSIFDDILYSAIVGCFVMVLIDVYLSVLTGYSFMLEFEEYKPTIIAIGETLNTVNGTVINIEGFLNMLFYIMIASLPISTIIVVYVASLFLGKKLELLSVNTNEKWFILRNYKKYGSYICCSKKTFLFCSIYLVAIELLKIINFHIRFEYFKITAMSIRVVVIFFLLKDSLSFVMRGISLRVKSKELLNIFYFMIIYLILVNFKITFVILFISSFIINYFSDIRGKQINVLDRSLLKR